MTAKAHVRNLQNKGQFTLAIGNKPYTLRYGVVATRHGHSTTKAFYRYYKGKVTRVGCKAHSVWSTKHSAVKLSFPRSCFKPLVGHHVKVQIASTKPFIQTVDSAPRVAY